MEGFEIWDTGFKLAAKKGWLHTALIQMNTGEAFQSERNDAANVNIQIHSRVLWLALFPYITIVGGGMVWYHTTRTIPYQLQPE